LLGERNSVGITATPNNPDTNDRRVDRDFYKIMVLKTEIFINIK
jgi:hypothetical protein